MPAYVKLEVDGLDVTEHLQLLDYSESIERLDLLHARLSLEAHGDNAKEVAKLEVGSEFTLTLKDDTSESELGGDLVEIEHVRRPNGAFEIVLVGLDGLHRLQSGQRDATLWEGSHADIAKEIAKRNKLKAEVEGVETTAGIEFQGNVPDGLFLHQLARRYNYYARVSDKKLKFARRRGSETVNVDYADAGELRLRSSLRGIVTSVKAHGSDYESGETFVGEAKETDLQKVWGTGSTGVKLAKAAWGEVSLVLNQTGLGTSTAVKALAKAELQSRAERFVTGLLSLFGSPLALSGKTLNIKDGPWPFTGKFLIRETRHLYSPIRSYRTQITFGSDALPAGS